MPASPALMEGQQWGDRFHLLMQQREMGLPIDPVLSQDEELQTCLQNLIAAAPELFDTTGETFRQSEHERSLVFNNYWFTVVYDLLRHWRDRAEIIDWKTYLRPRSLASLQQEWQTRLYLYVLAETTDYPPCHLSMTYWFVRAEIPETKIQAPQKVRIPYSERMHQQTRQAIEQLTNDLTRFLEFDAPFPQVCLNSPKCDACPFAVRCQRGAAQRAEHIELPSFDEIEEIAI